MGTRFSSRFLLWEDRLQRPPLSTSYGRSLAPFTLRTPKVNETKSPDQTQSDHCLDAELRRKLRAPCHRAAPSARFPFASALTASGSLRLPPVPGLQRGARGGVGGRDGDRRLRCQNRALTRGLPLLWGGAGCKPCQAKSTLAEVMRGRGGKAAGSPVGARSAGLAAAGLRGCSSAERGRGANSAAPGPSRAFKVQRLVPEFREVRAPSQIPHRCRLKRFCLPQHFHWISARFLALLRRRWGVLKGKKKKERKGGRKERAQNSTDSTELCPPVFQCSLHFPSCLSSSLMPNLRLRNAARSPNGKR